MVEAVTQNVENFNFSFEEGQCFDLASAISLEYV